MNCYLCGKSASIECYTCHQAWFCSHEHLEELHRPPLCFPIKVATSEAVGRYLVASRDLAPLDLILSDTASPSGLYFHALEQLGLQIQDYRKLEILKS